MMLALRKEGWVPKYMAKKDWAALLGQGFAAGVGIYNNHRQEWERAGHQAPPRDAAARASLIQTCADSAILIVEQKIEEMAASGLTLDSADDAMYQDKLAGRIRKSISSYIASDPIADTWKIVDAEKDFGSEYGNSRADLICRDQNNALVVVDYKTKLTLAAQYRQKTIQEYANSHQMLHYAWAAGETYGEQLSTYSIGLAVLEPRWAFDLIPYPVSPETLAIWLGSARRVWAEMAKEASGETVPWMSANHSDNFGQCQYYKACFTHHYDPALMAQDYAKRG